MLKTVRQQTRSCFLNAHAKLTQPLLKSMKQNGGGGFLCGLKHSTPPHQVTVPGTHRSPYRNQQCEYNFTVSRIVTIMDKH
uniref:Uncharacterized protein n=1 Tax=Anguilla anguilla TaxID=7936 RepID=A0A0E9WG49_ANGAN